MIRAVGVLALCLAASACGDSGVIAQDLAAQDLAAAETSAEPTDVQLQPGGHTTGTVEVDGVAIDYAVVVPDGFQLGDVAPVLLALPPGGQDLDLTSRVLASTYESEALARGWVVISPAAPEARLYFQGSEALIPGFLDWVETWVHPEGDSVHLAGISNGGISAFRVAGQNSDRFASLVVLPGFPMTASDQTALATLTSIPVRMFVGELDRGWLDPMQEAAEQLGRYGADVEFNIVPGEGHRISPLADGVRIFDELDAARTR